MIRDGAYMVVFNGFNQSRFSPLLMVLVTGEALNNLILRLPPESGVVSVGGPCIHGQLGILILARTCQSFVESKFLMLTVQI